MSRKQLQTGSTRQLGPAGTAEPQVEADPIAELNDRVRPVSMLGLIAFLGFFVGLVGWAAVAPLASSAFASGKVEIEGKRKTVQHKEGGVVRSLLVREGATVQAGDPLIVLDDTQPRAMFVLLEEQYLTLQARIARLEAELTDADHIVLPPDLLDAAQENPQIQRIIVGQQQTFDARRTLRENQVDTLQQRRKQLVEQIGGFRAQIRSNTRQMELLEDELAGTRELQQKGHAPLTRVRALERTLAALEGEVGEYRGRIAQLEENDAEIEMQIISLDRTRMSEAAEQLDRLRSELYSTGERLVAARDVLDRTIIRAPEDGRILSLSIHTEGGVIAPGQALLDVVPRQRELIVKAALPPEAIDHVHAGMEAEVTFTAFGNRFTERVMGRILDVSADAKENRDNPGMPYYELAVSVAPDELLKLGDDVEMYPGMPVSVKIVTGERTALNYFLRPISRTFDRAFSEH